MVDIQPTKKQDQAPVTDDKELAEALAKQQATQTAPTAPNPQQTPQSAPNSTPSNASGLQFEESPVPVPSQKQADTPPTASAEKIPLPSATPAPGPATPAVTSAATSPPSIDSAPAPQPTSNALPSSTLAPAPSTSSPELDSIKKDALEELRPLVTKLDLPPEEKFDTLLLIIRSTDDKSLLGPAHDAAKAITDEGRRAQALLDVVKEIDYFAGGQG